MNLWSHTVRIPRVAACLGLVAMLISAPSFGQQKRPKVFECGPGRANQATGKCDCPAGKVERSEVLHVLNDTEEHSHCIMNYDCGSGKANTANGSCECPDKSTEQLIGTTVSCTEVTVFVLRPLRPSSITDIATLLPEVEIPRDRQPFVDRIEQALLDDPF